MSSRHPVPLQIPQVFTRDTFPMPFRTRMKVLAVLRTILLTTFAIAVYVVAGWLVG
jgi:hypothetical protein